MKQMVKDLIRECPVESIVDYIVDRDGISEDERAETFSNYSSFVEDILGREPVESDFVMLGILYGDGGKSEKETSLYKKEELLSKTDRDSEIGKLSFEDVDALSDEETDRITLLYPVSKNHAYEYALWDEIIGYEVIRENVEEFGLVPFVSEIIYKMTYFGFDEEELAEIREAVSITMSELDKARELPDEEREKVVFSAERSAAYFSFQDNRPFEEKERERIEDCKNAIKDKIIEFRTVMRYIDEI